MQWKTLRVLEGARAVAMLWLTGALLTTSGGTVMAQSSTSDSRANPVGAWAVQVTLRDCATNAPLGPAFNSLVTIHRGGTLSESAGSLFRSVLLPPTFLFYLAYFRKLLELASAA